MKRRLGLAIVVIAAAAIMSVRLYRTHNPAPPFNVNPIQGNARVLAESEVVNLLGLQFQAIRKVRQVPLALKQSFANFTGLPFDMNDPGEPMSTDYLIPGVSTRRLVFAGVGDSSALLVYEQGGYANTLNAAIFSYVDGGGAWRARLNDRSVDDVPALRSAVESGRFSSLQAQQ